MNIQIFGKSKCFDTKKAERYFKERRVKFQSVDLIKYGIRPGELKSVKNAVGLEALIDARHPDAALVTYLAYDDDKLEKLLEDPRLLKTPLVRNGRQATVGYCPDVWKPWEKRKRGPAGEPAGPLFRFHTAAGPPPATAGSPPPPSPGSGGSRRAPGRKASRKTGGRPPRPR